MVSSRCMFPYAIISTCPNSNLDAVLLSLIFPPLSSLFLSLLSLSFVSSLLFLLLPSQNSCRTSRVILWLGSRTPPCEENLSSSWDGSASTRLAAAACQSNCTISGGRGCRKRIERATREVSRISPPLLFVISAEPLSCISDLAFVTPRGQDFLKSTKGTDFFLNWLWEVSAIWLLNQVKCVVFDFTGPQVEA